MILPQPLDEALSIRVFLRDSGGESGWQRALKHQGQVTGSQRHPGVEQLAVPAEDRLHRPAGLEMIVVHEVFPADDDVEVFRQGRDVACGRLRSGGVGCLLGMERDAIVRRVGVGGHQSQQLRRATAWEPRPHVPQNAVEDPLFENDAAAGPLQPNIGRERGGGPRFIPFQHWKL